METAVSPLRSRLRPGGGRSNGVRPSLSSAYSSCGALPCLPPVPEPHATSWPQPRATVFRARRTLNLHRPACVPRPGITSRSCLPLALALSLALALACHLPTRAVSTSTAAPSEPRRVSGPCLTLGCLLLRQRFSLISAVYERNTNQASQECLVPRTQIFLVPLSGFGDPRPTSR